MKKLLLMMLLILINILPINSKINFNINKYGVLMVYFYESNVDSVTAKKFKNDCENAIQIALNDKKVKQIQLKDNKRNIIAWANRKNLNNLNDKIDSVINNFSEFDEFEITYDTVETKTVIPEEYHSDTYKNGVKISSYTSDYNGETFSQKTSTYISEGDIYRTETYCTPRRVEYGLKRIVNSKKKIKSGELIKLLTIYSIE